MTRKPTRRTSSLSYFKTCFAGSAIDDIIEHAWNGDETAMRSLMAFLKNRDKSDTIPTMREGRVPPPAFLIALRHVWMNDRYQLLLGKTGQTVMEWCRYANCPPPADWPDQVTIYRGASVPLTDDVTQDPALLNKALKEAARGLSWTTDRAFADKKAASKALASKGAPATVSATVPKSDIVLWANHDDYWLPKSGIVEVMLGVRPPVGATIELVDWPSTWVTKPAHPKLRRVACDAW